MAANGFMPSAADAGPVMRAGDANMTCRQIADEAATLSARMGGTPTGGALRALGVDNAAAKGRRA